MQRLKLEATDLETAAHYLYTVIGLVLALILIAILVERGYGDILFVSAIVCFVFYYVRSEQ